MPRALMAKLHSWFSAKSRRCCSFITPSTVSRVCSGDSGVLVTGITRPLTFIDGGTPAVMNRSEPPFSTIRRSSFSNSMMFSLTQGRAATASRMRTSGRWTRSPARIGRNAPTVPLSRS